jgi:hypothetical protein
MALIAATNSDFNREHCLGLAVESWEEELRNTSVIRDVATTLTDHATMASTAPTRSHHRRANVRSTTVTTDSDDEPRTPELTAAEIYHQISSLQMTVNQMDIQLEQNAKAAKKATKIRATKIEAPILPQKIDPADKRADRPRLKPCRHCGRQHGGNTCRLLINGVFSLEKLASEIRREQNPERSLARTLETDWPAVTEKPFTVTQKKHLERLVREPQK